MEATDHPLSQLTFQLASYCRSLQTAESQFHRMALAQLFHETVLGPHSLEEVIEEVLPEILALDAEDFYRKSGADLLETALVLSCLRPCASVAQYHSQILESANSKELSQALSAVLTSMLQSSSSAKPACVDRLQALNADTVWQRTRLFACVSFTALIDRSSLPEFSRLLKHDVGPLLSVLEWPENAVTEDFLASSELGAMLLSLQNRVADLKNEDLTESLLKVLTHLMGLFPDPDVDWPLEDVIVTMVFALESDFYALLQQWRDWYVSIYSSVDDLDQRSYHPHGISSLLSKSLRASPYQDLYLPCVLSNLSKFQRVVPIANLLFSTRPEIAVKLIHRAVDCVEGEEMRTMQSPFAWVTEYRQWTLQFLKELLDLRRDLRVETEAVTSLFRRFLQLFSPQHRFLLMRKLAIEYQYDQEVGLILSLYLQELPTNTTFRKELYVLEMTKIAMGKRPLMESSESIGAGLALLEEVVKGIITAEAIETLRKESVCPALEELSLLCSESSDPFVLAMFTRLSSCAQKLQPPLS